MKNRKWNWRDSVKRQAQKNQAKPPQNLRAAMQTAKDAGMTKLEACRVLGEVWQGERVSDDYDWTN